MPAAWISTGLAVYSAYNNNKNQKKAGSAAANAADPFASERTEYQEDLRDLMRGEFTPSDPSYKWRFDQGMEGVNRGAAASGMLRSGNRLAELETFGQNMASQEYSNQFARLSRLAGADIGSPSTAAQIIQNDKGNASAYTQRLIEKAVPAIGNWWTSLNTGNNGGGGDSGTYFDGYGNMPVGSN